MKLGLFSALSMSFLLTGCCTSAGSNKSATGQDQEWGDIRLCGIFSGWGTTAEPERFDAVYTPISAAEYGEFLCKHLDIEQYASCVNRVEDFYRNSARDAGSQGSSNAGPFAVVVDREVFLGSYRSDPFSAYFRVSSGTKACRGSYNAFAGSSAPIFDVRCNNGRRGKANIVRSADGRNGIGVVYMEDGTKGTIVFGAAAVEGGADAGAL